MFWCCLELHQHVARFAMQPFLTLGVLVSTIPGFPPMHRQGARLPLQNDSEQVLLYNILTIFTTYFWHGLFSKTGFLKQPIASPAQGCSWMMTWTCRRMLRIRLCSFPGLSHRGRVGLGACRSGCSCWFSCCCQPLISTPHQSLDAKSSNSRNFMFLLLCDHPKPLSIFPIVILGIWVSRWRTPVPQRRRVLRQGGNCPWLQGTGPPSCPLGYRTPWVWWASAHVEFNLDNHKTEITCFWITS